jgi:hypothetical protein
MPGLAAVEIGIVKVEREQVSRLQILDLRTIVRVASCRPRVHRRRGQRDQDCRRCGADRRNQCFHGASPSPFDGTI